MFYTDTPFTPERTLCPIFWNHLTEKLRNFVAALNPIWSENDRGYVMRHTTC